MALFGNALTQQRKRTPMPWETPGIGDGLPGAIANPSAPPLEAQPVDLERRPGFFGQGGTGRAIAGNIGDFLLQQAGASPMYAPTMQMKLRERMAQLQEEREYNKWVRQQEYQRANPRPVNNDTVADYEFIRQKLGNGEADNYLRNRANPPRWVQLPNGQWGMIGGASPSQSGPQPGAVEDGYRFKGGNPADPNAWEKMGGPSPSGSGNFPQP